MEVKGVTTLFSLPCRWHQLSLGPHPGSQSVPIPKTTTPDTTGQPGDPAKGARYLVFACKLRFTRRAGQRLEVRVAHLYPCTSVVWGQLGRTHLLLPGDFHFQAHFRTQRMASVDFSGPGCSLFYPPVLPHVSKNGGTELAWARQVAGVVAVVREVAERYHGTRGTLSTDAREIQRHSERASPPGEKSHDVVIVQGRLPAYPAVAAIHPLRNRLPVPCEASQCLSGLSSKCQNVRLRVCPWSPGSLGPS
ncbi:hypothetical protein NCU03452 [Neurospora crassa OR74A]|uniref:Uncharacterized protein n=1 Tax=Neurospora crassa (strain ATCC 24698 / 74-OR23-1A / CBS 708.71 / DSM 1257 / FGSC 987) TaxID=367110 RepID=Q7RXT9_NEUCR|nr:hypothetical protein NCU03452 [Neurospora crassa OR74A]EAA27502.3 hypothetical protein NCU03452 [Neurospora crassa OR74A]|eukprot:XP_956738.3 hypothetical protein NCU03452 [Neurospora crassa OR74A]